MQTLLYVSSMTLGDEVPVREAHEQFFPTEALAASDAVEQVAAFIGSGFYALELRFADDGDDFQQKFHQFVGMPEVQAFFDRLRPYIDELPAADSQTAELHLASPMLFWDRRISADAAQASR